MVDPGVFLVCCLVVFILSVCFHCCVSAGKFKSQQRLTSVFSCEAGMGFSVWVAWKRTEDIACLVFDQVESIFCFHFLCPHMFFFLPLCAGFCVDAWGLPMSAVKWKKWGLLSSRLYDWCWAHRTFLECRSVSAGVILLSHTLEQSSRAASWLGIF